MRQEKETTENKNVNLKFDIAYLAFRVKNQISKEKDKYLLEVSKQEF